MNTVFSTSVPKGLLGEHECEATIITCIDFRFRDATLNDFIRCHLGLRTNDPLTVPGGIKGLVENDSVVAPYMRWALGVSSRLHKPRELVIVHHSTCGAYSIADAKQEFARHAQDLQTARTMLAEQFTSFQKIRTFIANGDTEKSKIDYEEIT